MTRPTFFQPFRRVLAAVALLALLVPTASAQDAIDIGTAMPLADVTLKSVDGRMLSPAGVKGDRGTVVVFWCNTCPWVKKYEERMVAIASEYQEAGFGFIVLNPNDAVANPAESYAEMQKRARDHAYSFPYVVDEGSRFAKAYGATRTPEVFVFDATDKLVYTGTIDDSPSDPAQVEQEYLRAALNQIAASAPIEVKRTKAFGCTIKFQNEGTH